MWEKINKLILQNAMAAVIIAGCIIVIGIACFHVIPQENMPLINKWFDLALFAVVAWLYTRSKGSAER
jgi:uncharacterized membrane protein YjgN (DUF898 family)